MNNSFKKSLARRPTRIGRGSLVFSLWSFVFALQSFLTLTTSYAQSPTHEVPVNSGEQVIIEDNVLSLPNSLQETSPPTPPAGEVMPSGYTIFDDQILLTNYAVKYSELSKEIILAMMKDDTLGSYKNAAAIKVFREKFSHEVVSREKRIVEKILLRRLNRTDSPFVEVEIMHTLGVLDRYKYFKSMAPALIQKLDHYNATVSTLAFESLNNLIKLGNDRPREARIVFHTLRKILFLSRRRLATIDKPGPKLAQKLQVLRWSIKVLGTQELKRLPKEVLNLM